VNVRLIVGCVMAHASTDPAIGDITLKYMWSNLSMSHPGQGKTALVKLSIKTVLIITTEIGVPNLESPMRQAGNSVKQNEVYKECIVLQTLYSFKMADANVRLTCPLLEKARKAHRATDTAIDLARREYTSCRNNLYVTFNCISY
jgi:hypothetical protein